MTDLEKLKAAEVCRHADPRCIDDPCPYGVWKALCKPVTRSARFSPTATNAATTSLRPPAN